MRFLQRSFMLSMSRSLKNTAERGRPYDDGRAAVSRRGNRRRDPVAVYAQRQEKIRTVEQKRSSVCDRHDRA